MKARDVLLVLAGGVVALVVAAIVMLAVDDDPATAPTPTAAPTPTIAPTPTAYQRRLTGAEAAAMVQSQKNVDGYRDPIELEGVTIIREFEDCEAEDFNEFSRSWVVTCSVFLTNPLTGVSLDPDPSTWLLSDATGEITVAN